MTVIWLSDWTVNVAAATPWKATAVVPARPLPWRVTTVPTGPWVGWKAVMDGAAGAGAGGCEDPPPPHASRTRSRHPAIARDSIPHLRGGRSSHGGVGFFIGDFGPGDFYDDSSMKPSRNGEPARVPRHPPAHFASAAFSRVRVQSLRIQSGRSKPLCPGIGHQGRFQGCRSTHFAQAKCFLDRTLVSVVLPESALGSFKPLGLFRIQFPQARQHQGSLLGFLAPAAGLVQIAPPGNSHGA